MDPSTLNKPAMRRRPPATNPTNAELEARLVKVDAWTQEPLTTAVAEAIGGKPTQTAQDAAKAEPEGKGRAETNKPARTPAPAEEKEDREAFPWELLDAEAEIQFSTRVPAQLHAKLKYLAETTYGKSIVRLTIEALSEKVDTMLAKRGIKPAA